MRSRLDTTFLVLVRARGREHIRINLHMARSPHQARTPGLARPWPQLMAAEAPDAVAAAARTRMRSPRSFSLEEEEEPSPPVATPSCSSDAMKEEEFFSPPAAPAASTPARASDALVTLDIPRSVHNGRLNFAINANTGNVIHCSPEAVEAGLRFGDRIIAADGVALAGQPLAES